MLFPDSVIVVVVVVVFYSPVTFNFQVYSLNQNTIYKYNKCSLQCSKMFVYYLDLNFDNCSSLSLI